MGLGQVVAQFGNWVAEQTGRVVPVNVSRYVKEQEILNVLKEQNAYNDAQSNDAGNKANQSTAEYVAALELQKHNRETKQKVIITFAIILLVMIILKIAK